MNPDTLSIKPSRVAELAVGLLGNWAIVYSFDFILYPYVIWKLGLLHGGIVMAILSLVFCLLTIWFYDWAKRDWLGIEAIKGLKQYEGHSRFGRFLAWTLTRSDWLACLVLSVKYDPFITMAYLRHGAFNGMNRRDWRIFLVSLLIGNGWWAVACFGGVELLGHLWKVVRGL